MKSGFARFICWFLAILSLLGSIFLIVGPIIEGDYTMLDFFKIPACAAILISPFVLMLLFSIIRGEEVKQNLLGILGCGVLFGITFFLSTVTTEHGSDQQMVNLFMLVAAGAYILVSFSVFCAAINEEDDGPSRYTPSRDPIEDLIDNMTGEEVDD